jgi:hypothetical protein
MKFHHYGVPTQGPIEGETYLPHLKIAVAGYGVSEFGIERMRFDDDAPYPELVRTVPHLAFEVDDLEAALRGRKVIIPPNSPSPGVRVAFIDEQGVPVEFLQIERERE